MHRDSHLLIIIWSGWTQRRRFAPIWSFRSITRMGLSQCLSNQSTTDLVQGQYECMIIWPRNQSIYGIWTHPVWA